ncbi:thioredoxin family protein [Thiobacter aerophilum]|uniref:Thioredoxin family protein n=1 Tax=Thiobacter aerophilum TaxID=3121275 RepID=A0ABV0EEY6_9BURK
MPENLHPPAALLVTLPGCPHCPGMKRLLEKLLDEGLLATLEVVDAASQPERAQALGVRSVPWLALGALRFEGQMTPAELRQWAQLAAQPDQGLRPYFFEMLKSGRRDRVEALIREDPARAAVLAALVTDPKASMAVRLGIGAVLEEFQGTTFTQAMAAPLIAALPTAQPRDRADIAHFLSLIGGPEARAALTSLLDDPDPEVREIAREAVRHA